MTSRIATTSNMLSSLFLATGLLCAGANASAQTTATVNVPFAFSADNQNVAAGSYKVELLSDRYLALLNTTTNQTQVLMVRPEAGQAIETRGRMVFHQDGSRKYLAQVWMAGTSLHSEMVVQHKSESQAARGKGATLELALK